MNGTCNLLHSIISYVALYYLSSTYEIPVDTGCTVLYDTIRGSRPLQSVVYGTRRALTFRRRGLHASARQAHGRMHSDRLGGYQHINGGEAREEGRGFRKKT